MIRFLLLCIAAAAFWVAPAAAADSALLPPGFTDSVAFDPASGRPLQVSSGGKAGAPTVVLIHGLGQQASLDWLPVLHTLARHYRVLIFDLPGFGRSDRADAGLSPKKYADLLHWLILQHTNEPVFVVGHSLGGAIALRHSYDYPEQVRRLLLIDAAGILQTTVFARHLALVPGKVDAPKALRRLVERGSRALNRVSGRFQDMTADSAGLLAALANSDRARGLLYRDNSNVNAALGLVNEDFSPIVREVRVPVWILWGEHDPVAPLRTGRALKWLLPQAQLDILAGVGHVPMSEETGMTVDWLLRSLKEPLSAAGPAAPQVTQGDALCRDQSNLAYRGTWRSIRLENCTNVRIENATLGSLVALRSTATLDNVSIDTDGTALEASRSAITATGLRIVAGRAFNLDDSRLDLAALRISARDLGDDKNGSLLYISLGYWCDGAQEWRLHDVWKPRHGRLDAQFRRARLGACGAGAIASFSTPSTALTNENQ